MPDLTYHQANQWLVRRLPHLAVSYARCVEQEEAPGPYIVFESLFASYLEVLLALPALPRRDRLLHQAFVVVEAMLQSQDQAVVDLACIAIFEGRDPWWLARARPFLGPAAQVALTTGWPDWRRAVPRPAHPDPERTIIDLYGVRDAVCAACQPDGVSLPAIPGISSPRPWTRLPSLTQAQHTPEGVVVLSCYGTSHPYVVAPATSVACDASVLDHLVQDLADIEGQAPEQRAAAVSACYVIPVGERVWRMRVGGREHGRYGGTLWIAPELVTHGWEEPIKQVLAGQQRHVRPAGAGCGDHHRGERGRG